MYSIDIENNIVLGVDTIEIDKLLAHEEVVIERAEAFYNYLKSIENYAVIPSILVCSQTFTIIDGHHRAWSLQKLQHKYVPVTLINYNHEDVVTHLNSTITKQSIIQAAANKQLLTPKSTAHHVKDKFGNLHPILLVSSLFKI